MQHPSEIYNTLLKHTYISCTLKLLGACILDEWKQRKTYHRLICKHIAPGIKWFGLSKSSSSANYNTEILSFVYANRSRTEKLSFEKLENDFETEIGPKIEFNTVYGKLYFTEICKINIMCVAITSSECLKVNIKEVILTNPFFVYLCNSFINNF